MNIKRTERGWGGHFICADRCRFKRNTLLEVGDTRIVISTVGAMVARGEDDYEFEEVRCNRHYETMAFHAYFDDPYWDSDVSEELSFESNGAVEDMSHTTDMQANDMHEAVVSEFVQRINAGEFSGEVELK